VKRQYELPAVPIAALVTGIAAQTAVKAPHTARKTCPNLRLLPQGTATGRLPVRQGEVGTRTLEVATNPAEMGLDAGALVEVNTCGVAPTKPAGGHPPLLLESCNLRNSAIL